MPCLVNLMPSGKYLMEDFYYAGGLPVVIREIGKFLHKKALTVNGRTIWDNVQGRGQLQRGGDHAAGQAVQAAGRHRGAARQPRARRRGAEAFGGDAEAACSIKGRAVVFENIDDLHKRIDDPKLDVDDADILVLKNCGPEGLSGLSRGRQLRAAGEDS